MTIHLHLKGRQIYFVKQLFIPIYFAVGINNMKCAGSNHILLTRGHGLMLLNLSLASTETWMIGTWDQRYRQNLDKGKQEK